jgi:lysozyme
MHNEALTIASKLIKESEGLRLRAYQCPAGKWTVGYGQTGKDVVKGTVWTEPHADMRLALTLESRLTELLKASPTLASEKPERLAAILDFVYNFSVPKYCESTLKLRVDQGNWVSAATEIKRWNKTTVNGVKVIEPGLVTRRAKEADLLSPPAPRIPT